MFRIPSFHQMEMTFEDAQRVFGNDLLKGMEMIAEHWDRHVAGESMFDDDDEFFDCWTYEVNAYNVVYKTFGPLFGAKV